MIIRLLMRRKSLIRLLTIVALKVPSLSLSPSIFIQRCTLCARYKRRKTIFEVATNVQSCPVLCCITGIVYSLSGWAHNPEILQLYAESVAHKGHYEEATLLHLFQLSLCPWAATYSWLGPPIPTSHVPISLRSVPRSTVIIFLYLRLPLRSWWLKRRIFMSLVLFPRDFPVLRH